MQNLLKFNGFAHNVNLKFFFLFVILDSQSLQLALARACL